jgi:hypothetical protein
MMKNKLKKVSSIILESEEAPQDPRFNDSKYGSDDLQSTGGGRVQHYPEGDKLLNWMKIQDPGFIVGYMSNASINHMETIFKGSNVSAYEVKSQQDNLAIADTEWTTAQNYQVDQYLNVLNPQINTLISQAQAEINNNNIGQALAYLAQIDSLNATHVANQAATQEKYQIYSRLFDALEVYIKSARIVKDPFQLDDPTVAANKRAEEKRKRDQAAKEAAISSAIEKEIEKLKADNKELDAKRFADTAKMVIGLGLDAATAVAVLNVLSGPADEVALQAAKKGVQSAIDDVAKLGLQNPTTNRLAKEFTRKNPGKYNPFMTDAQNKLAKQQGLGLDASPLKTNITNSYEPQGQVLLENRKRILREIKKPYVLSEIPKQKYKMNFSGKFKPQNTPDVTASSKIDELIASGNAKGQKWRLKDKHWQGYETTERMNIIYDRVGHGDQAWEMIIGENQNKKKEHAKKLQEHLNIIAHERAMRQENVDYTSPFRLAIQEQETIRADKDPLFKKVSKRLKKEIDYSDKPSKNGYPNDPPPEMINGMHPEYGNDKGYYNKLDPQSAEAMPLTGNPEIDKKVKKARKQPK